MTTNPNAMQWTKYDLKDAMKRGDLDSIVAARQAGLLDEILTGTPTVRRRLDQTWTADDLAAAHAEGRHDDIVTAHRAGSLDHLMQ